MTKDTVDSILDFAIGEEELAAAFYRMLAERADTPAMKKALEGFALEEDGHKRRLVEMRRSGAALLPPTEKIRSLAIADNLKPEMAVPEDLDYRQALELAMNKEKGAFRLYSALAENAEDETTRTVFLNLAQEEAKHKLRFEIEYEDGFLDKGY